MSKFDTEILQKLIESIETKSDKKAFCINEVFFTYKQLGEHISKIRKAIKILLKSDIYIGLVVNDDIETYASIFALWLEGKAYIPLHPKQPKERNAKIIDQVGISTVLYSKVNSVYADVETINTSELILIENYLQINKGISDETLVYILFTSGSTGNPKGVPISRKNLSGFIDAFWYLGITLNSSDRCLQMFELTFDLSVMSYLVPLLKGACVYTIPQDQIKFSYIDFLMDEHKLTFSLMVPSILNYLKPYFDEINYPDLKYSLFCGEALHLDITQEWSKVVNNAKILNVYGPTENTIFCTSYLFKREGFNKAHNGVLSIGKKMKNNQIIIIGDKNNILPPNEKGELCLSGTLLTPGYWKNDEKNDEMFFHININGKRTRFYKTGDICVLDDDRDILYIGRSDSQTQVQGFRVELSEIEFQARKFLPKRNIVAIPFVNQLNNTEIGLCIEGKKIVEDDFIKYLKTKLPAYMIPGKIIFIDKFPLNMSGKTDKNKLKKIFT